MTIYGSFIMAVTKWFYSFKELYQTELAPRDFDITNTGGNLLSANYVGSSPLRRKDDGLVSVVKMLSNYSAHPEKSWCLNADDHFYANRALITLSEERRLPLGENCDRPSYWPGKVLRIDRL